MLCMKYFEAAYGNPVTLPCLDQHHKPPFECLILPHIEKYFLSK